MQRAKLQLAVVVAVLTLGSVIGWFAGEPPRHCPSTAASTPAVVEQVVEVEDSNTVRQVSRSNHAFKMPYFSFKTLLRQAPLKPGS